MDIRVRDMLRILGQFDDDDLVHIGEKTMGNLELSHQFGTTQIQFKKEDNTIKFRVISTEEQYHNPEYMSL